MVYTSRMILINKGTSNNVVLTLNEEMTVASCTFLFSLVNDTTGQRALFTAHDTSTAPSRYNRFTITEGSDDPHNGHVVLDPPGYWTYSILEMAVTSPPDIDPDHSLSTLETGKALVHQAAAADAVFDDDDSKNNVVFE